MTVEDLKERKEIEEIRIRMSGMTTRLADSYIQELYHNPNEWITIHDHFPSNNAHRMLLEKILRRMAYEHPDDKVDVDKLNNRLKLTSSKSDFIKRKIDESKVIHHKI